MFELMLYLPDVSTSMTYVPGTGPQPVFPQAKFQVSVANQNSMNDYYNV